MADWDKALEEAVRERWREKHVFFIAQVKPFLAKQGIDVEALLAGRQVSAFLASEMPSVKAVQNELEPTNWGLVPADADVVLPASQYFEKQTQRRRAEFPFQNALRIAFSRPLAEGQRRWFSVNPPRFLDAPEPTSQNGVLEIPPAEIDPAATADQIAARVEQFLRANGLEPQDFRAGQIRSVAIPKGRTALHQILNLIPHQDHHRVTMPLDLVRKLLDRNDDPHQ